MKKIFYLLISFFILNGMQNQQNIEQRINDYRFLTAILNGELENVQQMIDDNGALLNTYNIPGRTTALHLAVRSGNMYLIFYFLNNGVNPTFRDEFGRTAAELAAEIGQTDIENALNESQLVMNQDNSIDIRQIPTYQSRGLNVEDDLDFEENDLINFSNFNLIHERVRGS